MEESVENSHIVLSDHMKSVGEFNTQFNDISRTWDQLVLFTQLSSANIDITQIKDNFGNLTTDLIGHLEYETLNKVASQMTSKAQVAVDIMIRNLFERTADIGFLATDDDVRIFLNEIKDINKRVKKHQNDADDTEYRIANKEKREKLSTLKTRFKEYVEKYSVYFDVVLFNPEGEIVARLHDNPSITKSNDETIALVKNTQEDFVETFRYHDFLPRDKQSLVYSYRITSSNESNDVIGSIALCFKFENEMADIFKHLAYKFNKETILLLDKNNFSIASSDPYHIPVGVRLDAYPDKDYIITQFAGRDYIAKSCLTNGYEGFFGLGWIGHIMIPLDSAFNDVAQNIEIDSKVLDAIMENENLFRKEILEVPTNADKIQEELDRAVWNGNITRTKNQETSDDFSKTILNEIRNTGEKTKDSFNISIDKLNETIITTLQDNAKFLATLSIDIMDRNLYERANDSRWWALTTEFRKVLSKTFFEDEDREKITNILKYINSLYTVYTNLFVYDRNGQIIAVSNDEEKGYIDTGLTQKWVRETMNLTDTSKYTVSRFEPTPLYKNQHTYIYNAVIKDLETEQNIGGIGIVFDSTPQFKDMLKDALPQENESVKDGYISFFVEKDTKKIISCSDDSHEIGEILDIDKSLVNLANDKGTSKIINYQGKYYIAGAKCSNGYREYKSENSGRRHIATVDSYKNDVIAIVLIEAGVIKAEIEKEKKNKNIKYDYILEKNEPTTEIGTFYVGEKWLGVDTNQIVAVVNASDLEEVVTTDPDHHFKGNIGYQNFLVSVINISKFIKDYSEEKKKDIVIIKYNDGVAEQTVGILINDLGDVITIPKKNIKQLESHLIGGGVLCQSLVVPPENIQEKSLLTVLDITKVGVLNEKPETQTEY